MERESGVRASVGLLVALATTAAVFGGGMATADAAAPAGLSAGSPPFPVVLCNDHVPLTILKISGVKVVPNIIRYPTGPNWETAARGPGTLTLSKSVSVANSYSGTITAAGGSANSKISAAVGFSVTTTYTTAASYTVTVPKGALYELRADAVYSAKTFKWKAATMCGQQVAWHGNGS